MFGTAISKFTAVIFKNSSNKSNSILSLNKIMIFRQARSININIKLVLIV